jgi:hypothetical protein
LHNIITINIDKIHLIPSLTSGGVWWRSWEVINRELVTRELAVRIGAALCDGGVANKSCSGSSSEGRLCVRLVRVKLGMLKQGEGVHVAAVRKGFELPIAAAVSDRISNRSSNTSNVGRLRV